MVIPSFVITVLLTMLYEVFKGANFLAWLEVSVLPAALAMILSAAIKLGKDVFRPSVEFLLAAAAFAATFFFDINPALVLIGGGLLGILVFHYFPREKET
jgi:chromate transporter